MFWVVYYLIFLGIFGTISRYSNSPSTWAFCSILLGTQIYDSSDRLLPLRSKFVEISVWESQLTSDLWQTFAAKYRDIIFVLPKNHPPGWISMSKFAVDNKLAINAGLVAHYDSERLTKYWASLKADVIQQRFNDESLYVFLNDSLWQTALDTRRSADFIDELDGHKVLAPRFYLSN